MTQRQEVSLGVILPEQLAHHGAALKRKGDSNEFQHFAPSFYADQPGQTPK
jgi:hypothetical protein